MSSGSLTADEKEQIRKEVYSNGEYSLDAMYVLRYIADDRDVEPVEKILEDKSANVFKRQTALKILCRDLAYAKRYEAYIVSGLEGRLSDQFLNKMEAAHLACDLLEQGKSPQVCELLIGMLFASEGTVVDREAAYEALLTGAGLNFRERFKIFQLRIRRDFNLHQDVDLNMVEQARRNQLTS